MKKKVDRRARFWEKTNYGLVTNRTVFERLAEENDNDENMAQNLLEMKELTHEEGDTQMIVDKMWEKMTDVLATAHCRVITINSEEIGKERKLDCGKGLKAAVNLMKAQHVKTKQA